MKTAIGLLSLVTAAIGLASCDKAGPTGPARTGEGPSLSAESLPKPRPGLWRQALSHDARAVPMMGAMQICMGAGTDGRRSILGEHAADPLCNSAVSRTSGGDYQVNSTCKLGKGGVVASRATAQGDFNAAFSVHVDSEISGAPFGPMNGHHTTDIQSQYLGPCPGDMKPGDVALANGLKVNIDKLRQARAALQGG